MDNILGRVKRDRAIFDKLGTIYAPEATVSVSNEKIDGVSCFWFTPDEVTSNAVAIYLHGGLFALGSLQSHRAMVSHLSRILNTKVLFVEYARSPENPFPQGVNDVVKVYKKVGGRHPAAKTFLIGDSAGGGLAVSAAYYLTKANLRLPSGIVLISPWLNLRCDTASYQTRAGADRILTHSLLKEYASYYAPDNLDKADPSQMPFSNFPPTFLLVGSNEVLFDDTKNFYEKIKTIQPAVEMKEYRDQNHVWLLTNIHADESKAALQDIQEFLARETADFGIAIGNVTR